MKTRIHNLGRVLTILANAEATEIELHEDVSRWHAPSECHRDVSRGEAKRYRRARKHAEALARAPLRIIEREARKRGAFVLDSHNRHYARLLSSLFHEGNP